MASMMAVDEVAQAETVEKFGPIKPYRIDIHPAAMSTITLGIKKGLILGVPSPRAYSITSCWKVRNPPLPDPQITPTRVLSIASTSIPLSVMASADDASAYCTKGSILRISRSEERRVGKEWRCGWWPQ